MMKITNLKRKFNVSLLVLGLCSVTLSCSDDFLEQPAIGAYGENALMDAAGIQSLLTGAYGQLNGTGAGFSNLLSTPQSAMLGSIRGGEALIGTDAGDGASWEFFPSWNISPTTQFIPQVFTFYYNAINMTNQIFDKLPDVKGLSDIEKTKIKAEASFLRAHFYFILKRIYGNIPWIDETNLDDVRVPNTDENGNFINIWPNIEADMKFAADNLPPTQVDIGRANSWAAKAYLVKIRIEQKKYDNATYTLLMDVINNGTTSKGEKYGLMPNYRDNFDAEKENNKEAVFQIQMSVNAISDGPGDVSNPESAFIGFQRPGSPGNGRGYGYYQPSQWFVDHFRVNNGTGLPFLDYYSTNPESVKNDYGLSASTPFEPETKPLDPRLDWIVGRRGIPYLGWGVMPGPTWLRDATGLYGGPYAQKKWFYEKKYEGVHNQANSNAQGTNTPVIRFADVLLWAAEIEVRVNSNLPAAVGYVNQVRARMQNQSGWVLNEDGTAPAANYKIGLYTSFANSNEALNAILYERTLELGLEGSRFYDVVRFGDEYIKKEFTDYATFQGKYTPYLKNAVFQKGIDEYVPFSQTAIINSQKNGVPTLTQNPGY